jgi:hypothetical protein
MPVKPLLARIRKLIPTKDGHRYNEIVSGFDDGSLKAPGHKPTGASFVPDIGNPLSGSNRAGQLEGEPRTGDRYDPETVKRMMQELWGEYVEANPTLFDTSC